MRFQDELLSGLASLSDAGARQYILRQLGDLPQTFDFGRVIAALRDEERGGGELSSAATTALTRLLGRHLAAGYGIDPSRSVASASVTDPRSRPGRRGQPPGEGRRAGPGSKPGQETVPTWVPCLPPALRALQNEVWLGAGSHLLEACLEPLLAAAASPGGPRRPLALRCLSRLMHHRARGALIDAARNDPQAAIALARTGDPESLPRVLEVLSGPAAPRVELVPLLVHYPAADVVGAVKAALHDADPRVRAAGAIALEGMADARPLELAGGLLSAGQDRWPLVHAADSLGRAGSPDDAPALATTYRSTEDPIVRIAIVRAVVNLGGQAAATFCLEALEKGSDHVRAVVLGALVRLGVKPGSIGPQLMRFLDSSHPRLALNAAIVLASHDPATSAGRAVSWLRSADPGERERGAFLLGYLPSPASIKIATKMATRDPSAEVRAELLRCLSKYPRQEAGPALESCLGQEDAPLRARAIRLHARSCADHPSALAGRLMVLLKEEGDPGVRAEIVEQLGLTGELPVRGAVSEALRAEDAGVAAAAARAIGVLGDGLQADELKRVDERFAPAVRGEAAAALWALGDMEAAGRLGALLAGPDAGFEVGARTLEEICLVLGRMPSSRRHVTLQERISQHIMSPAYQAFASERLGIRPMARVGQGRAYTDVQAGEGPPERAVPPEAFAHVLGDLDVSAILPRSLGIGTRLAGLEPSARPPVAPGAPSRPDAQIGPPPVPRGWSARTTGLVLAVAFLGMAVAVLLRPARTGVSPGRGPGGPEVVGTSGVSVVAIEGSPTGGSHSGAERPLAVGAVPSLPLRVRTGDRDRVTVAIGLATNTLRLEPGTSITIDEVRRRGARGTFDVTLSEPQGAWSMRFEWGDPEVLIRIGKTTFESGALVARFEHRDGRVWLGVGSGQVQVRFPDRRLTVEAGQQLSWEGGATPAAPSPWPGGAQIGR